MSKYLIYGLIDPRTQELRYIGKSTTGMRRPQEHIQANVRLRKNTPTYAWINKLVRLGLEYEIHIFEEHEIGDTLYESEQWHIAQFRALGCRLTNLADGGPGNYGVRHGPEVRARMSRAQILNATPERRIHNSRANGGRPVVCIETEECFPTQREAARQLDINYRHLCDHLKGRLKKTGVKKRPGGYTFFALPDLSALFDAVPPAHA